MAAEPLTIAAAAPLIRSGELTPSELLEQCLRRIDIYEPAVQAWVYLDRERARRDATRLTDEAKAGRVRGPLHGVPVGVKDIIDVFDMPTGCGSKLWANSYARRDATVVERLRQAGAVILGKTVTTPYAYLDPPPTRNPWNLDRTPGGSSSGSAAAVACGMCLAALGTQTGGSTIRPASYCGVASIKPTHGAHDLTGVLPLAPEFDHIGVMTHTVADLAVVLTSLREESLNYAERLAEKVVRTVAVPDSAALGPCDPDQTAVVNEVAERLRDAGWQVQPVVFDFSFDELRRHHRRRMAVGTLEQHGDRIEHRPEEYPPRIGELIRDGAATIANLPLGFDRPYSEYKWRAHTAVQAVTKHSVLLTPAATGPAPTPETTGDPSMNSPWSCLSVPAVSVPVRMSRTGLPLAVQLVGQEYEEDWLLGTAHEIERLLGRSVRLPPVPA